MTQDDIIRMAREAGFAIQDDHIFADSETGPSHALCTETVKRFAALVAAAEREECAKVCEQWEWANNAAEAIRARGSNG